MSLGADFYIEAARPWHTMVACLQRQDLSSALNAVSYDCLVRAFRTGVERVCRQAGVTRETVTALLPEAEMQQAAAATTESQGQAVGVWNQHQNSLTVKARQALGFLFDVHLGLDGLGLGDALTSWANSKVQDVRLQGPMAELQAALGTYDQWLQWGARKLDDESALNEAYRSARWKRRGVAAVIIGAVASLGGTGVHIWMTDTSKGLAASASASIAPPTPTVVVPAAAISAPMPVPVTPPASAPSVHAAKPPSLSARPSPQKTSAAASNANGDCSCNGDLVCLMNCPARSSVSAAPVRPVEAAPTPPASTITRPACLRSCIAKCQDDPNCERTCAAACPL
jgi:hypothetical protein